MIPTRRDPIADLAETVGQALLEFAERLRAEAPPQATAAPAAAADAAPDRAKLGAKQVRIVEVLAEAGEAGLKTAEVAEKADITVTNAPRALKALVVRGLVTASDTSPVVWRVTDEAKTDG